MRRRAPSPKVPKRNSDATLSPLSASRIADPFQDQDHSEGAAIESGKFESIGGLQQINQATGITSFQMLTFFGVFFGVLVVYLRVVRPKAIAGSEKHHPV